MLLAEYIAILQTLHDAHGNLEVRRRSTDFDVHVPPIHPSVCYKLVGAEHRIWSSDEYQHVLRGTPFIRV